MEHSYVETVSNKTYTVKNNAKNTIHKIVSPD